MTNEPKTSKTMNLTLWVIQIILAGSMIWAAAMKLFQSADQLAAMWPWTVGNETLVKTTGILDLLAGVGLVLPGLLRIRPQLTIYAAYGIVMLMIAACMFHISRGEASLIGINIFFGAMAVFVIWGRK